MIFISCDGIKKKKKDIKKIFASALFVRYFVLYVIQVAFSFIVRVALSFFFFIVFTFLMEMLK